MVSPRLWRIIAVIEIALASILILLDLLIPTILLLALAGISLLVRHEGPSTFGFKKPKDWRRMIGIVALLVVGWTLFHLAVTMPVLNRLTGERQDLSTFEDLKGNLPLLLILVAASWTLAALGEETVYRGYLQRRMGDFFGNGRVGIIIAIAVTSILFGLAHTEQGVIGVVITTLDAIFFSLIKRRFDGNLWAPILAHGMSNTFGLIAFFLVGPIYGLW